MTAGSKTGERDDYRRVTVDDYSRRCATISVRPSSGSDESSGRSLPAWKGARGEDRASDTHRTQLGEQTEAPGGTQMTNLVYAMLAIAAGVGATVRAVRWFIPTTASRPAMETP